MKVTLVSSGWPPSFGGADTHPYRLLDTLRKSNVDVEAIVSGREDLNKWNGDYKDKVTRINLKTDFSDHDEDERNEWLQLVKTKLCETQSKVVILFNQFIRASKKWIQELQAIGIKVLTIMWDIDYELNMIVEGVKEVKHSAWPWNKPYNPDHTFSENLRKIDKVYLSDKYTNGDFPFIRFSHSDIADGVIHITQHNLDTYNYITDSNPHAIVVHPFLNFTEWLKKPDSPKVKKKLKIGVVNCNLHKGQTIIRKCIMSYPDSFFHVLLGGWGDGKWMFKMMERFYNYEGANSKKIEYVEDMKDFYDGIDVLLFPTFSEGYGQVVIEAACRGVPTLTKDYPALHESGGTGAFYVGKKDYLKEDIWMQKINTIQEEYSDSQNKAYKWSLDAQQRQEKELNNFINFLVDISSSS